MLMQIVLTPEDIRKLRPATRQALFAELGLEWHAIAKGGAAKKPKSAGKRPAKVSGDPLAELVESINDRARAALTVLVNAGGESEWAAISSKVPKLEPGRFLASIHRRYRTLTGDHEAVVVVLDDDAESTRLRLARGMLGKLKKLLT